MLPYTLRHIDRVVVQYRAEGESAWRTGGRPLSRMTVEYDSDFGYRFCNVQRELRCEFSSPVYPVRLTLYSVTSSRDGEHSSVAVFVDVPDPTP